MALLLAVALAAIAAFPTFRLSLAALVAGGFACCALNARAQSDLSRIVAGARAHVLGVGQMLPLGIARAARWSGDDRLVASLAMSLGSGAQIALPLCVVGLLHAMDLQHALASTVGLAVGAILPAVAFQGSQRPAG